MIYPLDALQLAATKLKTRRIRLIVTVVVTSLLFAVLTFMAIFSQGVLHSLKDFGKEGYGGRFLVQATPSTYAMNQPNQQDLIDQFKQLNSDLIAQKKAAAKRLSLTYDDKTDMNLPLTTATIPGGETQIFVNPSSKQIVDYYRQKNRKIPGADFAGFTKVAKASGAISVFRGTHRSNEAGIDNYTVTLLQDGKEQVDQNKQSQYSQNGPTGMQTITTLGWNSIDDDLLLPFVLPHQNLVTGKDGSIPTVVPKSVAEEVLGLKALPQTASPQEKLQRLVDVRKNIAGKTAQLCYRNSASAALLSNAIQQQNDIAAHKNDKDYVKPSLLYVVPTTACAPVTIATDKRTADEKKQANNQQAFDEQFGTYIEPTESLLSFRIVGVNPDIDFGSNIGIQSILTSLLTSSLGGQWLSPTKASLANPVAELLQNGGNDSGEVTSANYYAEFTSLAATKRFIAQQNCTTTTGQAGPSFGSYQIYSGSNSDACIAKGKIFNVTTYGNSAGAIEEFRSGIWKVARVVILVVLVIASVIMMGNVGKIIADSRRETAVFRALGAKRLDINQIYITYTLLVSLCIIVVAIVIGFVAAYYLNVRYSQSLSVSAVLAYSASDVHKQFLLFGVNLKYLGAVAGLVFMAGMLGALLPLLTNIRRNPIRDMRDDT